MDEDKLNEIRVSMILIQESGITQVTKVNNIIRIAGLLELHVYGDKHKSTFVEESSIMIERKQYFKWKSYLKKVLLFIEDYNAITSLHLEKS